jgi:hypothetical protein
MKPMGIAIRAVAAITLFCGLISAQTATTRTITQKEARLLVYTMLKEKDWTKLPRFIVYNKPALPENGFYSVHAEHDNPLHHYQSDGVLGGSAIGHYAVDQTTGDVWDWVVCGHFSSPALLRAQRLLRKNIGISSSEYLKLRQSGPGCKVGEAAQTLTMARALEKPVEDSKK